MKWSRLEPNEFYFSLGPEYALSETSWGTEHYNVRCQVAIVPISYFNENKSTSEDYLLIDNYLPEWITESIWGGFYLSSKSSEEVKKELIAKGFKEDKDFNDFTLKILTKQGE